MKKSYLAGLFIFALGIGAIAFLSSPKESTWLAMYLDNRKLTRAEELLSKRYRRNPEDLENAAKLVETLRLLDQNARAKEIVLELLGSKPENRRFKRELAFILLDENDLDGANRALSPDLRDDEFRMALARKYHEAGKTDEAEKTLLAGIDTDAGDLETWSLLAKWRAEKRDSKGEYEALQKALGLSPENVELWERLLFNRSEAGDVQAALRAVQHLPQPLERRHLEALHKVYIAGKNYPEAKKILEQLIARPDALPADYLALVSVHYELDELRDAQKVLDQLAARMQKLDQAEREAFLSQSGAVKSALLLEAAQKGMGQPVLAELEEARSNPGAFSQERLRNLVYACLRLSDFHKDAGENKEIPEHGDQSGDGGNSRFWLEKAVGLFDAHREELPLNIMPNARLKADLAERTGNWRDALEAWESIADKSGDDIQSLFGVIRSARQLREYDLCWNTLLKAEKLARDEADFLALASMAQMLAEAMPPNFPGREVKKKHADFLAHEYLKENWNRDLALNLFYRSLDSKKLGEAAELLEKLSLHNMAPSDAYLALAEAQLAAPSGQARQLAALNALKSMNAADAASLPRLLYIFVTLGDKARVAEIIKRIESARLPETPELLAQLSEAYGFLGNQNRQLALLEKRAILTGRISDWLEAIDRLYWAGDSQNAVRLLDKAESLYPDNAELFGRRISILSDLYKFEDIIKIYRRLLDRNEDIEEKLPPGTLAIIAQAYDKTGFENRSRRFYKLALARDPDNERALYWLADLERRAGNQAEAASLLQKLLKLNPGHLWARAALASVKPEKEKRHYAKLVAASPAKPDAVDKAAVALALRETGQIRKALDLYAEMTRDGQTTPSINCDYAQALIDADKIGRAKTLLKDVIREAPRQIRPYMLLASIFIREKDFASAENCFQRALIMKPGDYEATRGLGFVQEKQQKAWAAQKAWRDAGKR